MRRSLIIAGLLLAVAGAAVAQESAEAPRGFVRGPDTPLGASWLILAKYLPNDTDRIPRPVTPIDVEPIGDARGPASGPAAMGASEGASAISGVLGATVAVGNPAASQESRVRAARSALDR